MVKIRKEKVLKIQKRLPLQEVLGEIEGDLLVVSWGGTNGSVRSAVEKMIQNGHKVSQAHFRYIYPLPANTLEILSSFKKVVVCELNDGQFVKYLMMNFPQIPYLQYNKIQGLPFTIVELTEKFTEIIKEA